MARTIDEVVVDMPVACSMGEQIVAADKGESRALRSRLIASDSDVRAGSCLSVRQAFTIGPGRP